MKKVKESAQDQRILAWIKERYGNACRLEKRHADRYTEAGLPDLNIVVYGVSIQIEDKVITEFPRDNQLLRLLQYQTAGAITFWCDSMEMFERKWETLVEGDRRFQFMKAEWESIYGGKEYNWAHSIENYKQEQEQNREAWMQYYKETR